VTVKTTIEAGTVVPRGLLRILKLSDSEVARSRTF
jgi:hypothetical protein